METPSISGAIDGYNVSIFESEHSELDGRSQKRLSAIEIGLHTGLPVPCAIASAGMVPVVETLDLRQEFKPNTKNWDDSYIARTNDSSVIAHYLEGGRLEKLLTLMKTDKAWVVVIFLNETGLLRLDTPLPLDNPRDIDVLVKQMLNLAKALELKSGEDKDLLRKRLQTASDKKVLDIDEDLLSDDIGLELEEDHVEPEPKPKKSPSKTDAKKST